MHRTGAAQAMAVTLAGLAIALPLAVIVLLRILPPIELAESGRAWLLPAGSAVLFVAAVVAAVPNLVSGLRTGSLSAMAQGAAASALAAGGLAAALTGIAPAASVVAAGVLMLGAVMARREAALIRDRGARTGLTALLLVPAAGMVAVSVMPALAMAAEPLRLPVLLAVGMTVIVAAAPAAVRGRGAAALLAGVGVAASGAARPGTLDEVVSLLLLASSMLLAARDALVQPSQAAGSAAQIDRQLLPQLAAQLHDGVLRFDGRLQLRDWNRSAETLLGLDDASEGTRLEDLLGLSLAELPGGDETVLHRTPVGGLELRLRRDDDGVTVLIRDPGTTPEAERLGRELRGTIEELLQARRTIELQRVEIERASAVDPLTGVASRPAILDRLRLEVAQARRYEHPVAIALIDIDDFADINRAHGLSGGDAVLREAALRIRLRVREADALGRAGSDGFLAILPHTDEGGAAVYGDALRGRLAQRPIAVGDEQIEISVSIGVAVMRPGEELDIDGLLARAEEALRSARVDGGNRIALDRLRGVARLEEHRGADDEPLAGTGRRGS